MSRKRRKRRKKVLSLPTGTKRETQREPQWDAHLNVKKVNQLWNWVTLEDVKF